MSELLDQIETRHSEISKHAGLGKSQRRMLDAMFESAKDVPRLLAAVRAVEAVHEPIGALNVRINRIQTVRTGCGTDDGNWQVWPCPTIRALTEALEGER